MFILLPFILHRQQEGDTPNSHPEGTSGTGDSSHQPHPLDPTGTVTPSLPVPGVGNRTSQTPRETFPVEMLEGKSFRSFPLQHPATPAQHEAAPC